MLKNKLFAQFLSIKPIKVECLAPIFAFKNLPLRII